MDRRITWGVVVAAVGLLALSFGTQATTASAESSGDPIAAIGAIAAGTEAGIDGIVSGAGSDLENASTTSEANEIRNWARSAVDDLYDIADDQIAAIVDEHHNDEQVEQVAETTLDELGDYADAADQEIKDLHDAWKVQNSAPPAAAVIDAMTEAVAFGVEKITKILDDFADDLGAVDTVGEAADERDAALHRIDQRAGSTRDELDRELATRSFDQAVAAAHAQAVADVDSAAAATSASVEAAYAAWQPPQTTTTVTSSTEPPQSEATPPPSPSPAPPSERPEQPSTDPQTAPPLDPDLAPVARLPSTVATPVGILGASATGTTAAATPEAMPAVGLVRRVVDTQLPAGLATVAAGPLVVLGLVVDAVLAAGGLMLIPWALLAVYMVGLLRRAVPVSGS
ncbi:MAG: hypothetical protein HKN74_04500 [Acidimicrobiia bacterium]|nr:hypothetical protein [Acidimicrobiia bacterium]